MEAGLLAAGSSGCWGSLEGLRAPRAGVPGRTTHSASPMARPWRSHGGVPWRLLSVGHEQVTGKSHMSVHIQREGSIIVLLKSDEHSSVLPSEFLFLRNDVVWPSRERCGSTHRGSVARPGPAALVPAPPVRLWLIAPGPRSAEGVCVNTSSGREQVPSWRVQAFLIVVMKLR